MILKEAKNWWKNGFGAYIQKRAHAYKKQFKKR